MQQRKVHTLVIAAKSVRRLLFWLHLSVGLGVAIVVAFLAITGILLGFQAQLTRFAEHALYTSPRTGERQCLLQPKLLIERAQASAQVRATSATFYVDARRPALLTVRPDTVFLVNACNGTLLAPHPSTARSFFARLKDLHRWVALAGVRHETLRAIKNGANLGFSFLVLSGLSLWFPRAKSRAALRSAFLLRSGLHGRSRDWNLHNVLGFWFAMPLLLISLSGTVMAYAWANTVLYRAAGSPLPKVTEEKNGPRSAQSLEGLDALVLRAQVQDPAWQALTVRLPAKADKTVGFTLDDNQEERPQTRNLLTLTRDGSVLRWEPYQALPKGRRWRLLARYIHTGELFGILGQIIAVLASLTALVLVWTGVSLAVRRLTTYLQRRSKRAAVLVRT